MWATRRLKPLDTFGRGLDFGRNERLGWLLRFTVERRDPLATAGMGLVADYGSDGSSSDSEEEYPDAGGRVELIAHVEDTGETRGVDGETRGVDGEKATSLVQDLVEFPQHKASIVLAGMADIKRDSGATLEYIQGKVDAMSRVRGVVGKLVIRGDRDQVAAARIDVEARLETNAVNSAKDGAKDGAAAYVNKKTKFVHTRGPDGKREKPRIAPEFDWKHSGQGWDNGGLVGSEGALGSHCTWR
jgi:hypothetical protein